MPGESICKVNSHSKMNKENVTENPGNICAWPQYEEHTTINVLGR